jgi:hypothetical protein
MTIRKLKGRGRVVPSRATGIAYPVRYGIRIVEDPGPQGKGTRPAKWTKCSVQLQGSGRVPDGEYYLYTEEGRVHQLKSIEGKWQYLDKAA